jgi:hypothetical protein
LALFGFIPVVRRGWARGGADYTLIRTGEPVDGALVRFLARRTSMAV